ncbi:MAG: NAD(P)-dependent glycerol-3-phosphate dehydrogenase [Chlamydiae bacterium]|nr:NAD(P)-dependent glycerol-3-phosphate dehydrogenase [Chlamydiota bacterium]
MKICYLGAGTWGTALAFLLSQNGHEVIVWDRNPDRIKILNEKRVHPKLENFLIPQNISYTANLKEALQDAEMIIESITSSGIRKMFEMIKAIKNVTCPIVITSKGIEQKTGLLLPEVIIEVLGEEHQNQIGCLSGPSHAEEVIRNIPTSVVCSAYDPEIMNLIGKIFNGPQFRVYPNSDIRGVTFGGAMKNIVAIACGISDGLGFGDNTKAALMTRGLHEMRKLCETKGASPETLIGLSGLGDLCVTCLSKYSRNYTFGRLIAEGYSVEKAKEKIGMAIEGIYTCVAALELARKYKIPVPITEGVYAIIYQNLSPRNVVNLLFQREIKNENE